MRGLETTMQVCQPRAIAANTVATRWIRWLHGPDSGRGAEAAASTSRSSSLAKAFVHEGGGCSSFRRLGWLVRSPRLVVRRRQRHLECALARTGQLRQSSASKS